MQVTQKMIDGLKNSFIQNSLAPAAKPAGRDISSPVKGNEKDSVSSFAKALGKKSVENNKSEAQGKPDALESRQAPITKKKNNIDKQPTSADKTSDKSSDKVTQKLVAKTDKQEKVQKIDQQPKDKYVLKSEEQVSGEQFENPTRSSMALQSTNSGKTDSLRENVNQNSIDVLNMFAGLNMSPIATTESSDLSEEQIDLVQNNENAFDFNKTDDVMSEFLEELKTKFGVSPEELVAAMAALSPTDLQLPPEQNVAKIIENLNLKPHQKLEAKKLFQDMVVKTEYTRWADYIKGSGHDLNAELMTKHELGKEATNQKVDRMNAAFFMNQPLEVALNNAQKAANAYTAQLNTSMISEGKIEIPPELVSQGLVSKEGISSQASSKSSKEALEALINKALEQNPNKNTSLGLETNNENASSDSSDGALENLMKELGISDNNLESAEQTSDFSQVLNPSGATMKAQAQPNTAFSIGVTAMTMTEAQKQENVAEVVQSARLLAQDGGGEMRVTLNPDQMGEVNLKVNVKDGQVNVEIITETAEAKKLFEKGLVDLKANLASHRLNVEGIKVDTAQNLANEFLNNQSQQQERNLAQNFLQQFKQDNRSWRSGFLDEGAKRLTSQLEDKADITVGSARKTNSARKLDLVA